MWLLALILPAHGACPVTAEELRSTSEEALARWAEPDAAGFLAIDVDLSCLVASVLQRIDPHAAPGWYLPGGLPLPAKLTPRHTSRSLLVAGSAVAVVGAGALVTAALLRERYLSPDTSDAEAEGLIVPNLAAGAGGLTLVVGGAGLGAAALIVGEW